MLDDFLAGRSTVEIARDLLGKKICYQTPQGIISGYIVEDEAYLGQCDRAAHAFGGHRSKKNEALYWPAGTIYIYTIYGQFLLNIITQKKGNPQGILIRGVEPDAGVAQMQLNRHWPKHLYDLTNGPGKLMSAFGIQNLNLNLNNYVSSPLTLDVTHYKRPLAIAETGRIGINDKGEWQTAPLRFYVAHNPFVSRITKREMNLENNGWQK
ncbi:DNA-3-methyladenine glycosylase [Loigolactobacillus backii]|uniref:Putative 3-methyladenine DNA glycosylase n=1 Tax=Loigolactobacillus backii TaxID=375175 RepID=A0A192H3J7_9LACO|nr:DNA-3-methyladenine glycosylase [Loigolactobacillus backii]ANK62807.1 3-methyladenine DNA glycosylase [Loigolactobacillus backii]ANK64619.1 3-methyladenine DNA glycosylase [Loigolactobacillus backii]ANK66985.1 3-methyladenine DNA glycosylase [Loigolactobacillus backii]ANK70185.1 3-methyladenine DNA glycosylase [Loigolactobacillus backii]MDA5388602.1 DNA-3-methyladenine glycosylase [Loigolactobacillus backii]